AAVGWTAGAAWRAAGRALADSRASSPPAFLRALTAWLHATQPIARLVGRLGLGLTPWRSAAGGGMALPRRRVAAVWAQRRRDVEHWGEGGRAAVRAAGMPAISGGPYDGWDLGVRAGKLSAARVAIGVEAHERGTQLARLR